MAEWNKGKVLPQNLHNNQEFENGDNLAIEELNAIVNNSFYASEKAEQSETTSKEALDKINQFVQDEGKTAVTLNGEVQPTWSADFSEAERQKSKNLFDLKRLVFGSFSNASINYNNETITLNQRANSTSNNLLSSFADLEAGKTYTLSFTTTGNVKYFYINDTGFFWTSGTSHTITQEELDSGIHIYGMDDTTVTISNIQIEAGTVATDYQPYNGAIVHEKQLNEAVEKRELFYDVRNSKISIESSTLTTLREFFDLFGIDDNKIYICAIGNSNNNNFKNLLPSVDMGGYVLCYIKLYANDYWGDLRLKTYEIIAHNQLNNQIAKGYLYYNLNKNVVFTGWTKIGQTESSGGGSSLNTQEFTTLTQAFTFIDSQSISYDNILELEVTIGTHQSGTMQIAKIESSGASFSTSSNYRAIYAGTYSFKHSKPENAFTYYGSSGVSSPMIFYELIPYSGHTLFKMKAKLESLSSAALTFYSTTEDIIVESDSVSGNITNVKVVYIK